MCAYIIGYGIFYFNASFRIVLPSKIEDELGPLSLSCWLCDTRKKRNAARRRRRRRQSASQFRRHVLLLTDVHANPNERMDTHTHTHASPVTHLMIRCSYADNSGQCHFQITLMWHFFHLLWHNNHTHR